jgi:D-glycero-D-manno-heptose 1,7-bisphosphate phosphatase
VALSPARSRPAVFLDKDGTLVEDVPYNVDPAKVRLRPGAGPALRRLADEGFALVVVTNQSGVARGLFPAEALHDVKVRLREVLAPFGAELIGFHACPHHPQGSVPPFDRECECRKPKPGLLLRAAEAQGLDLHRSWMVGDILDDIEAGRRAGCRTVLIDDPNSPSGETEWRGGGYRTPHAVVAGLEDASRVILAAAGKREEGECQEIFSN